MERTGQKNWRQDLNLLTGTAVSNDRNMTLSPDVDLVAYGVAKNVTALQLSIFVQDRGADLLDCTQLTKFVQDRGVDLLDCTQLTKFVQDRGVDLLDCTQLTKFVQDRGVDLLDCTQLTKFVQDRGVDLLDCTQLTKFVQDRGVDLLDCTQLTKFVQDRGVDLLDCTQLTKYEGTRSLAFKVTIKPNDFENCMNAEVWPYGVGLRQFKHFIPRQSSLREDRPKSSNSKDGQIRRIHDDELTMHNHIGTRDNRFRKVWVKEDALIARNA